MASLSFTTHSLFTSKPQISLLNPPNFTSQFLGIPRKLSWSIPTRIGPSNGSRATCWFRFGNSGVDAEGAGIYGSQSRDDFDRDDVEQVLLSLSFLLFFVLIVCSFGMIM